MKVLVIGKPNYDYILECEKTPLEGESLVTTKRMEMSGGVSVYVACMLSRWGLDVSYAGLVSGDEIGNKIKNELESYGVNIKNIETNYECKSNIEYVTLNTTNGKNTRILLDNEKYLTKFKYDFVPDYIIVDGSDIGGANAAANNYPTSKIIMLGNKLKMEYGDLAKRCQYVCSTLQFANAITKMDAKADKPKSLVNLFQKIQDLNKSQYILMLGKQGVLYVKERQVKMIPAVNVVLKDEYNYEPAFYGAYCYGIIKGFDMDLTAKIANMSGFIGTGRAGFLTSIPDKEYTFTTAGETEPDPNAVKAELKPANEMPAKVNEELPKEETPVTPTPVANESANAEMPAPAPATPVAPTPATPVQETPAPATPVSTEGTTN